MLALAISRSLSQTLTPRQPAQAKRRRPTTTLTSLSTQLTGVARHFTLPISPKKRIRSSSLPPVPALEFTLAEDSIEEFGKPDLENPYDGIYGEECPLSS